MTRLLLNMITGVLDRAQLKISICPADGEKMVLPPMVIIIL